MDSVAFHDLARFEMEQKRAGDVDTIGGVCDVATDGGEGAQKCQRKEFDVETTDVIVKPVDTVAVSRDSIEGL
jgi:hypothetical protein